MDPIIVEQVAVVEVDGNEPSRFNRPVDVNDILAGAKNVLEGCAPHPLGLPQGRRIHPGKDQNWTLIAVNGLDQGDEGRMPHSGMNCDGTVLCRDATFTDCEFYRSSAWAP